MIGVLLFMSQSEFKIGKTVRYPNGLGEIIAIQNLNGTKFIKTKSEDGEVKTFPNNLSCLKLKRDN